MYYKFDSVEHFKIWHEEIKIKLGIPKPDGITTEYTDLLEREGQLFAFIDDELSDGLTVYELPSIHSKEDADLIKKIETF